MIKQYLSRAEAARVLGCDPQTISNYASRRLFETMKTDKRIYVEKSSFEKFVNEHFEVVTAHDDVKAELERELAEYKEKIQEKFDLLKEQETRLKVKEDFQKLVKNGFLTSYIIEFVNGIYGDTHSDEREYLLDALCGTPYQDIAFARGVTRSRVAQRVERAVLRLRQASRHIQETAEENVRLQARCNAQHATIKELQRQVVKLNESVSSLCGKMREDEEKYMAYNLPKSALKAKLQSVLFCDLDLSVRSLKALMYRNCNNLLDVVRLTKESIMTCRNTGKKSLVEIEVYLQEWGEKNVGYGLTLDMNV